MVKRILLILFCAIMLCTHVSGQYSSYLFNGLILNPAYAGSVNALSITLASRYQWVGFEGAPKTNVLTAHSPLVNKNLAVGLTVSYDQFGLSRNTDILGSFSYKLKFNKTKVFIGAQLGYTFMNNNWGDIDLTEQNDPKFSQNINLAVLRYGVGIYITHKKYFIGASLPAQPLKNTNEYSSSVFNQEFIYGGYNFFVSDNFIIKPSILIKRINSASIQADYNLLFQVYNRINAGFSFKPDQAITMLFMVNFTKQLSMGYSYDYLTSSLRNTNKGTHEILIRYDFRYSVRNVSYKTLR